MEMIYKDGEALFYKTARRTTKSGEIMLYFFDVTLKVQSGVGDLFTVNSRISGFGLENTNQVMSQVYIY